MKGFAQEDPLVAHLRRAGELLGAKQLPAAEVEILRALSLAPDDLRAHKLLGLVRFKQGRMQEARDAYKTVVQSLPDDAAARLHLGLIAMKLERLPEAVVELEAAAHLGPGDRRVWGYLGHVYSALGREGDAAVAFGRASGDEGGAAEGLTAGGPGTLGAAHRPSVAPSALSSPHAVDGTAEGSGHVATLTAFTVDRLVDGEQRSAPLEWLPHGVLRLHVQKDAHIFGPALMTAAEGVGLLPGQQRCRGQVISAPLGADPCAPEVARFYRSTGAGDVWLSLGTASKGRLMVLSLEDDILYLREDRVVAFDGDVVWECGRIPVAAVRMIQFRGSGRVVVDLSGDEIVAVKLPEDKSLTVDDVRLMGWIGRVIVRGVRYPGQSVRSPHLACEGEGVLLLSQHRPA